MRHPKFSEFEKLDFQFEKYNQIIEKYKHFLTSESFKDYKFDKNDLLKIKIDLSFVSQIDSDSGETAVEWAKEKLKCYPEIKPLIHVLKRYLCLTKLNSCFNGGLSSFSLLLMVIAYIKYPKTNPNTNLGAMLNGFLEFFGKYFNFNQFVIDVNNFK